MQDQQQFPIKHLYQTITNTTQIQKKFKPFINQFKNHNMHWIYQTISAFAKIINNPKQSPIVKFNTLLAIKYCFDTCQYTLITLIQVYLLGKITDIALFRSKVKDQSSLVTYFITEGYKQSDHNDLKKISYNYVMLAIEFIFISSLVKKFRCVENIQIKQSSRYAASSQTLNQKGIKRPQKFSFFLPDYVKENSKKYQNKLEQFGDQVCQIYSQYFLGIMIAQLQTGKKGSLQIRSLLSYGDAYLTSAMINLCEDQLTLMPQGLQNKKKYLNLFHEFVRWGDIEAVLMINNSDFITKISVNICTVRGQININQGQNIYPQIPGKKVQKREFYTDFLRCIETWADCIPLNEQGNESNVRRIHIFLRQEKKFKFPQNLILKRYKKQLEQNMKKNQQRNQKLLQIINNSEQQQNQIQTPKSIDSYNALTKKPIINKKQSSQITFQFLQKQIQSVEQALQQIISIKINDKQSNKKLSMQFQRLNKFKQNWVEWLQKIDLDSSQIQQQDQQKLQQIILDGDQTMQAIQIVTPLIQMFQKNKLNLEDFIKRMKQTLDVHQDLSISRSKQLQLTKSMGKSLKKSLTNTIQKSILNLSHHKNLGTSKFDSSTHQPTPVVNPLITSMSKSKPLNNPNIQKSNLANSLYKSNNYSETSSVMRKSRMHQKLHKLKQNSEQIAQMVQSRHTKFSNIQQNISSQLMERNINKQPFKHVGNQVEQYFQQNKSIAIRTHQQVIKEEDKSQQCQNSKKSNSKQKSSRNYKKQSSLKSSRMNRSSQLIQSPGSSRNFKSQKNITVVSRKSKQVEGLEEESNKVVQDMNLSNEVDKVVVEYSDIDENQIEKKANQREQQQIIKNEIKRSKKKQLEHAFMKVKIEDKLPTTKVQQKSTQANNKHKNNVKNSQKNNKISPKNELKSSRNQVRSANRSNKNLLFSDHNNEYENIKLQNNKIQQPQNSSSTKNIPVSNIPTKQKLVDRLTPLNEDYGGKQERVKKYDNVQTPKRSDRLQKTKKSQSKISIVSDDKQDSMRSSKSIKDKLKSRISQRRSLIKDQSQRSLQSQIRAMRMQTNSNQSRSLSRKKIGLVVTQINQKSKLKIDCNEEYNHLPNKVKSNEQISPQLSKTKKISQTNQDFKNRHHQIEQIKKQQKPNLKSNFIYSKNIIQQKIYRNIEPSSLDTKPRHGISLSLGKKGSIINTRQSIIKRGSILKQQNQKIQKYDEGKQLRRQSPPNYQKLRQQYFNHQTNNQKQKNSNRERIKKRLHSNRSGTDSDSSCGDIIRSPDHKPMIDSHYTTKQIQKRIMQMADEKPQFKKYIQNDLNKQIICPKTKQIENIIKYGSKRQQIQTFIQHNPHGRKVKSQDKYFYGSLMKDKSTQKQVSQLQDKLKTLQNQTRNMKTKLAVRDQQIKSFKNTTDKGFVQFTTPSQSNYFTSSDGFRTSRNGSQKALFSPMAHQFLKSQFQNSSLIAQIKHAKSSSYKQYFQKIKGNTFKKTLLKSKSLIQKQDEIQIGCMNVRKQDFSLQVTIFITPLRFDLADINYTIIHDDNVSSQCYPKKIINIELKKQQKIHIKMIVKKVPFSIPEFQITYKSKSQYSTNYFRIPIPTLFNKFCQLQGVPLQTFQNKSFSADRTMMTSQFKLNSKVVKLQKIKQVLTNFSYSRTKQLHILTSIGTFKDNSFWLILKINDRNHCIMEGVMQQGQHFKYLQFLLITFKNIFEIQQ